MYNYTCIIPKQLLTGLILFLFFTPVTTAQNFANALLQIGADLPYSTIHIKGIYPNPFLDKISLLFIQIAPEDIFIELYDIQGKMIKQKRYVNLPGGEFELTIDNLGDLSQGIYIIKVLSGEYCYVNKLVK